LKIKNKMGGTIAIVAIFSVIFMIVIHANTGFLATMAIAAAFLAVALLIINFLEKREKNKKAKNKEDDNYPTTLTSSEAMDRDSDLDHEFSRLVSEISHYQARAAGKEVTFAEAKAGVPDEKLISPEDIDVAFKQALKELQPMIVEPQCASCETPANLVDKIRNLRKKYESQTP